jgi:plastocyanin
MSTRVAVLCLATCLTAIVICAGRGSAIAAPPQEKAAAIKIDNFSFGPSTLTVPVGTMVTWTNQDDLPHTVVSAEKVFQSKALDTGDKFSFTFSKPGTYDYFCSMHPRMTGKIVVD